MTLMSLLGHDNITLVDLTEALPSSLSLSSSLSTNVQMVGPDGSYTPDFTTDEVIITPSFFIGSTEIPVANYLNLIYYHCGEMDGNQEKDIAYDASIFDSDGALIDETTSIYVDSLAQLHYRKNLVQNIEIEAFISGFIYNNITYPLARTINPINILRLEYNDEAYSAFMTTEDGREHFEEGQENDITLVAQIYQGAQEVTNVTYTWYQVGSSGLETLPDTTKTLTVARGQIDSTGTFICDITAPNGTVYRISKTLTDRTDSYFGTISANSSLILTPEHSTVTLTNQIWHRTSIINDPDSSRFTYAWSCIDEDNQVVQLTGVTTDEKSLVVDINGAFPKKDLVIYCEATIDGKAITNSYISLSYSPITYSVYVEPRTVFVPANANGSYRGETSFSKEIKFQLLNDTKEPLTFGEEDTAPSLVTNPIFAASITQVTAGKWDYLITLTIQDTAQFQNGFNDSYSLAFTYEYLGVAFSEEVEAIKNISGSDGEEGSGYTVILTNESFVFPANNSAAIAGAQGKTSVMAFRNTTPLAATITSINNNPVSGNTTNNSGLVSNMDVTITGNGTTSPQITFAARSTLTNSGTIPIIISTSGGAFTKIWSYSLSFRGIDGSNGTTLISSVVTYQVSTNGNNPPSGEWLTSIPSVPEGRYLWTRTVVTYSDGTETASYSVSKNGEKGQSGTSVTITSTEIEYVVSTSGTTQPSSGWQTTLPSIESGSYLWTRTTVNYSDGTNTVAYSVAYQGVNGTDGVDGSNGEDGVGLASSLVEYTVSSNGGPTPPSSGWETTIPTLTPGQYLWTRLTITYTDQTTTTSYSVSREGANGQDGQDGQDGTSISILSQTVRYQYSNNGNTPPSGTWLETVPPTELGKYLWTCTEVSYSDGTITTSYSVAYQGVDGENGTSVTIVTSEVTYQVSTSGTTQPTGDWLEDIPTVPQGQYLWTKTYVEYSNGESITSYSVARQGVNGQDGANGTSVTITSTSVTYQISDSGTVRPTGEWSETIPDASLGSYLWSRTIVNYSDGNSTTSYGVAYQGTNGTDGIDGTDGVGLASSEIDYAIGTNGTTPPSTGWGQNIPDVSPGQYLWTRITLSYTDGETSVSYSVSRDGINGQDGQDGQDGASITITGQEVTYQYSASGTVIPSGNWSETIPPVQTGEYLWTRSEVTYSDTTTTVSYSVAYQGIDGENGTSVTIQETSVTYQVSNSGITRPTGDWSANVPEVAQGQYLWTKTYVLYSNGESITSYSVARQGVDGSNGQDGTSVTITSTSIDYQISTDGINPPSGTWNTNIPSVPNGQFLWTRTIVNYSDGSSTTSYSVSYQGTNGTNGTNGTDGRTYSVIANSDYIVYQVKNGVPSMTPATLTLNAYTYIGVSTVPTPFSGGTLAFFGRNVYNSWVELSSIAGATLSVNLNQTNFYPYKEFKYQLRTEDYILDEQTIPVLRDGVLNGGRNLIIGSDNTWTRDFDDTGKLEFSLNVTRNIAYSEYQGQYLTLSFDRVFSPTAATMCTDVDDADKDEDGNAPFGALVRVTWSNGSDGQIVHEYCEANYHPDMTEDNTQRYMTTDWIEPPETGYSISLVEIVIQLAYYPNSSGTIFSITRPQLEFGFDASAWTIAPEDLSLETIKGLNLITNSYRYSVDSSIALYNSIEIPADDDYILSWQNVERAPIITENELITVEVVDAVGSVLSTQNITVFNSPGSMLFENLSMGEFIRIYCGNKSTITVSDNSIITFTQIKLERGRNATSWLASDSDIIQIVQQIQEDTANEIGAASDAVLNVIQEDGTIVRTTMDDWQSLLSTNSYFVGGDNQDTPNFEALKSYANFYHATYQEGYGAYLERISSGIDLGYETDGTPYLTLSTNSYSSGEFSMRLTNTQLGFYKDGKALAWFSSSKMFIPIALIRDQLIIGSNDFGGISFIPTSSGIAVTWIDSGDAVFEN